MLTRFCRAQDAEALKAVQGQTGTLVLDLEGQVLSASGQLAGDAGEQAAEAVFSILQVRHVSLSVLLAYMHIS